LKRRLFSEVAGWAKRLIGDLVAINCDLSAIKHKIVVNFSAIEHSLFAAATNGL
jgi:hypothetical protein